MSQSQKDYSKLLQISRQARILSGIAQQLDWDQETYMPKGAAGIRAQQLEMMAGIIHSIKVGKKFSNALSKLIDIPKGNILVKELKNEQISALKIWRGDYLKEKALPKSFVEEFAKLSSLSILAWRQAKKENSFKHFSPFLQKLLDMTRKKADYLGYTDHPYDALIDQYEPQITTKDITALFKNLRSRITSLLKKISSKKLINDHDLHGNFSTEQQLKLSHLILKDMGYNETYGRLDLSTHPFSSASHPTDSRITTRIHPDNLMSCLSVVLHEGGHALYEMGLPQEHYGSPLGDPISLGMHESQSRWWETRIGQTKAFWKYYLPILKKYFPGQIDSLTLEDFYRQINKVEASLIRVEADEVTYSLHIILRFELECALIEGKLSVEQIPEAWNAKMQELLGIQAKKDSEGCLQDIHWSMGAFGYFPTYTLGNLYAAQFFKTFESECPDWQKEISSGNLLFITEWLRKKIHQYGRQYSSEELIEKVSGSKFSSQAYINYLEDKYQELYNIKFNQKTE